MASSYFLTNDEKKFLLQLARDAIASEAKEEEFPSPGFFSKTLKKEHGVFVSLHKDGDLRGCIGYIEGIKPIQISVKEMALSAAFKDPRFPPISLEELESLDIEISVLSQIKKIKCIEEIEVGKHGLIIEKDFYKGLLLPQVAVEYNWDRESFLQHTCNKAGLPQDAWKDKETKIYLFSADIFSEKDLK